MPRPDWDTELEFTPEELADMGAELAHPPARPAQPPAAAGAAAARRKRVSSLRIPVDAVPRTESGRIVASAGTPPPLPRVGAAESASDAVVERAFQFTARGPLPATPPEEAPAGASLEERKFEQTLRGYSVPDSAVPVVAPEAPAKKLARTPPIPATAPRAPTPLASPAVAPPPPPPPPRDPTPLATPALTLPAAPTEDAIALDDADMIVDQVEGAAAAGARVEWPEVDTPPTGSDLAALNAAAARLKPPIGRPPVAEAATPEAVEPVETEEISEPEPSAAPSESLEARRGERAFIRVDTVPEAPVGGPPPVFRAEPPAPAPPAPEPPAPAVAQEPPVGARPADAGVVLAVFDAFGSRPNSILRTDVGDEAQRAEPTPALPAASPAAATPSAAPPPALAPRVAAESGFAREETTDVGPAPAEGSRPAEAPAPAPLAAGAGGAAARDAAVAVETGPAPGAAATPPPAPGASAPRVAAGRVPTYAEALEAAEAEDAAEAAREAEASATRLEPARPLVSPPVGEHADLEPEITVDHGGTVAEERAEELSGGDLEEIKESAQPPPVPPPAPALPAAPAAAPAAPVAPAPAPSAAAAPAPPAAAPAPPTPAAPAPPTPAAPAPPAAPVPPATAAAPTPPVTAAAPAPPATAAAPAPSSKTAAAADEPAAEELSGADLEEIPDLVADQVAGAPAAAAAAADREPGAAADRMMAAAMTPAARPAEEEEEELSGADLEEVHEAPTPKPPTPVAAGKPSAEAAKAPPPTPTQEPKPARRRKKRPWFEEVFDEDYLRTLPFLTPEQTRKEVGFLEESLGLSRDMHVLDLGCGWGRHAMELAARGYRVTGLDLSLALLLRAADEAQRRGLQVNFVHGDMRELSFDEPFDAAYCMGTSFGFFDDDTNRKVAQGLAQVVKPGGRLLVEAVNRDYIIGDLPARVWWEGDGCVVLEEVEFNYYTSRLVVRRSVVFEDGRQLEHDISVRVYSLHEVGRLLQYAGFRVLDVSGHLSMRGRFFGAASRQILVVAERRSTPQGE